MGPMQQITHTLEFRNEGGQNQLYNFTANLPPYPISRLIENIVCFTM